MGVDDFATAGVDEVGGGFHLDEGGGGDEVMVEIVGLVVDVDGEDVGAGEEFVFGDGGGGVVEEGGDVEEVVVEDGHLHGVGDFADAAADIAHAEDGEGFAGEFEAAEFFAVGVEGFVGDGVGEVDEGAAEVEEEVEDVLADGAGVGGGSGEDLDVAGGAGGLVDVVEADAGAADDFEQGGVGEEGGVDLGVGADD